MLAMIAIPSGCSMKILAVILIATAAFIAFQAYANDCQWHGTDRWKHWTSCILALPS
jgi:hypothetical protein